MDRAHESSRVVKMLLLQRMSMLTIACMQPPATTRLGARSVVACARNIPAGLPPHLETMAEELVSGEAQLFDVREPQEAMAGKLKASVLVPMSELREGLPPSKQMADPTKLTYLHCAAGIRVHPSAEMLQSFGYERVVPLQEGFATLANYGFELE